MTDPARHLRDLACYPLADQHASVGDESSPAEKALYRAVYELVNLGDRNPQMWSAINDSLRNMNQTYTRGTENDRQLFG